MFVREKRIEYPMGEGKHPTSKESLLCQECLSKRLEKLTLKVSALGLGTNAILGAAKDEQTAALVGIKP